jgi:hypothetical protein
MAGAAQIVAGGQRALPTWLITTYLLHTFGELCLSPVGLSSVTKLAPRKLVGQMMGVWFLATSLGNLLATKPISLTGQVQRVDFVNPHGWLYVQVKDPNGRMVTWNVEMGSPNSLIRRGFTKNTVAVGTQVVIDGYRAKDGSRTMNSTTIKLPDGRRLFTGSPGTGAPETPPK